VKKRITEEEIMAKRTARGGWTKEQAAQWGVPWPLPKGWIRRLVEHGIPYSEHIQIFGGGRIVAENKPLFCLHCNKDLADEYERIYPTAVPVSELAALVRRRKADIVKRTWPDGRWDWMCHSCGREVKP
jgi:hypothetical protein